MERIGGGLDALVVFAQPVRNGLFHDFADAHVGKDFGDDGELVSGFDGDVQCSVFFRHMKIFQFSFEIEPFLGSPRAPMFSRSQVIVLVNSQDEQVAREKAVDQLRQEGWSVRTETIAGELDLSHPGFDHSQKALIHSAKTQGIALEYFLVPKGAEASNN